MSYSDYITEDQRLVILQALASENDLCLAERLLQSALDRAGHRISRELVKSHIEFLASSGAVALDRIDDRLIATLARAGLDHLERRAFLKGVARPDLA